MTSPKEELQALRQALTNLHADYAELLGRNTALELKVVDLECEIKDNKRRSDEEKNSRMRLRV
jgi:predicted  nucleic acid-binding Zn-ribbon protein